MTYSETTPRRTEVLVAEGLQKSYGPRMALRGLSFVLKAGRLLGFLGPNGAGKTTSIRILTTIMEPDAGNFTVDGISHEYPDQIRRRIGVLPEDLGLFDDLTVEEHLMLTGDIYGVPREDTRTRTAQLLHALSLEHGRRTFAAACSHGMRKKTAFAMALLPNPQVLFLDEPFEAIDPVTAKIMRDLLQSVARHGVTVFLTSHILSMVERIANQIVMIRKGSMVWNSAVGELPQSLEDHYFDLVETPVVEELEWLGPSRS